ncbi:MAG: carbohydrate ABC transporter permease [Firmicutes bacterium]|nr:carbohydrate ABC transporter permease [Bacillota bacterium]
MRAYKIKWTVVLRHLALFSGACVMTFPFVWMILTSLKTSPEAAAIPPTFLPKELVLENFSRAWESAPFGRYFLNSVLQSVGTTVLVLFSSITASYSFSHINFKGKKVLFTLFLATMMVPVEISLIPNFVTIRHLGWYDTFYSLTVPFGANAFSIFMLRQAFMGLPKDMWDAAYCDGCGHFTYLLKIALPLVKASVSIIALLTFVGSWNSLLWPLIITSSTKMRTVQVGLLAFTQEAGTNFPLLMAASAFVIAPVLILFFFTQQHLIEGIAHSGVKG